KAKEFVEEELRKSKNRVRIRTEKAGKFGRWLAEVYYKSDAENENEAESNVEGEGEGEGEGKEKEEEKCLNSVLLEKGFAREYDGGKKVNKNEGKAEGDD
ncbi:MAG: thermonuclease family protein, partial [Candidatus Methanoperedens sp.]|nr:thermonuclease family protein [Candidatus Methanoperedens sp.]